MAEDMINDPPHYKVSGAACGGCGRQLESIDFVKSLDFCTGNAIKYLIRAGRKGSKLEDLQKSRYYVNKLIEMEVGTERDGITDGPG